MTAAAAPEPKPRRSEKRQRTAMLPPVRCTDEQRAAIEAQASRAGLSMGSYMLTALLKVPPVPASRVPAVERQALAQLLAQLGRLNGNVNQIAKTLNFGQGISRSEMREAAAEIVKLRDDIRAALGHRDSAA